MATDRFGVLLRGPEQGRAAYLELFLDLVFVLAFFRLSQELLKHLSWTGAFHTLVLLFAVFGVWLAATKFTDTFNPQQPLIQLIVLLIVFSTLLMTVAATQAFGRGGLVFAGTFVVVRLSILTVAMLLLRGHEAQRNAGHILFWVGMAAAFWIAGAFLPAGARGALWATGAAVEAVGIALGFPTPRLGRSGARLIEVAVSAEHVAERYQQFFIIALGEPILVTGLTLENTGLGPAHTAAAVLAVTTIALLWRIYIHRAGELLAEAIAKAPDPRRVGALTIYAHALMIAGIIAIAVADELVIQHPFGHARHSWIAVILGGPALFLAGRAIFEYAVFGRLSLPRLIGALALLAATPAMTLAPPLVIEGVATSILAGVALAILASIAASDVVRSRRFPSEPPSPPGRRSQRPGDRGGPQR